MTTQKTVAETAEILAAFLVQARELIVATSRITPGFITQLVMIEVHPAVWETIAAYARHERGIGIIEGPRLILHGHRLIVIKGCATDTGSMEPRGLPIFIVRATATDCDNTDEWDVGWAHDRDAAVERAATMTATSAEYARRESAIRSEFDAASKTETMSATDRRAYYHSTEWRERSTIFQAARQAIEDEARIAVGDPAWRPSDVPVRYHVTVLEPMP